jgi:hypothetical protein
MTDDAPDIDHVGVHQAISIVIVASEGDAQNKHA